MRETKLWTWHLIAGAAILVLLGVHMLTMHLGGVTGLFVADHAQAAVAPANSMARDSRLLVTIGYILLLGAALYHGLFGLRNIVLELSLGEGAQKVIKASLLLLGLALFGLGTWAAIAAHSVALTSGRV